jgi:uncharacterized membrane protein YbhN (UPF0104 family)
MPNQSPTIFDPRNRLRLIIGLVGTIVLFTVVFTAVPIRETIRAFGMIQVKTLLLALLISTFFNVLVYADRLCRALNHLGERIGLWQVVRVHLGTGPVRMLFPIQTGEIFTAAALARRSGGSPGKVFGTILYNKYLTLASTLILLTIGLIAGAAPDSAVLYATFAVSGAVLVGFIAFELKFMRRLFVRVVTAIRPSFGDTARRLLAAYDAIPTRAKVGLLLYSMAFQFSEVVVCAMIFNDLGIHLPAGQLMAYVQIMILASSLPISIAGAGTREGVALLLLASVASPEAAVAAGIAYTAIEYFWPLVAGLPLTPSVGAEFLRLGREANSTELPDESVKPEDFE